MEIINARRPTGPPFLIGSTPFWVPWNVEDLSFPSMCHTPGSDVDFYHFPIPPMLIRSKTRGRTTRQRPNIRHNIFRSRARDFRIGFFDASCHDTQLISSRYDGASKEKIWEPKNRPNPGLPDFESRQAIRGESGGDFLNRNLYFGAELNPGSHLTSGCDPV